MAKQMKFCDTTTLPAQRQVRPDDKSNFEPFPEEFGKISPLDSLQTSFYDDLQASDFLDPTPND